MSKAMNYRRPVNAIAGKQIENKFAERRTAWVGMKVLMKAKTWEDVEALLARKAEGVRPKR